MTDKLPIRWKAELSDCGHKLGIGGQVGDRHWARQTRLPPPPGWRHEAMAAIRAHLAGGA